MRIHFLCALFFLGISPVGRADPLVVHEWGTFTALQDEQGNALGRINTDDEPVPAFVHQMMDSRFFPPTQAGNISGGKGVPEGDPNVTMRLETPVLYFHMPKDQTAPLTLDVKVEFRGGWLTQYFPNAHAGISGANLAPATLPPLQPDTLGFLSWKALTINGDGGVMPQTTDHVWTAPRAVHSAPVTAGKEREQFLFYRGVGNLNAPLRVLRDAATSMLEIRSAPGTSRIENLWLVDIQPNGNLAFRPVSPIQAGGSSSTAADFAASDYSSTNRTQLRAAMHGALVRQGLFADEADGLLNTWERSYFRNPGQRLFFMVPQSWTDAVLPLKISVPADISRVMVGRIELVTPAQRALLQHMLQSAPQDLKEVMAAMTRLRNDPTKSAAYNALAGGHGNPQDLGVAVPSVYADFLALGRFRTALLLNSNGEQGALINLAVALAPPELTAPAEPPSAP